MRGVGGGNDPEKSGFSRAHAIANGPRVSRTVGRDRRRPGDRLVTDLAPSSVAGLSPDCLSPMLRCVCCASHRASWRFLCSVRTVGLKIRRRRRPAPSAASQLKTAAAPKFKGTMLMMNQPGRSPGRRRVPAHRRGVTPPQPAGGAPASGPGFTAEAPPIGAGAPRAGAAPAAPSRLKGTMVGVAPPSFGGPAGPAGPPPEAAPAFGAPPAAITRPSGPPPTRTRSRERWRSTGRRTSRTSPARPSVARLLRGTGVRRSAC